ncbi:uncharacterized protein METZ01_LOCUS188299 [marine metagenome]|uniref:Uncharacterized protein n=1 Tax=marine metagenome TaxID=408172 RepID=A0A382DB19_9ZZZZ
MLSNQIIQDFLLFIFVLFLVFKLI